MKRILLFTLFSFSVCLPAQVAPYLHNDQDDMAEPIEVDASLLSRYAAKQEAVLAKGTTQITHGEYSFVSTVHSLFGGTSMFTTFSNALYRDSTVLIEFSNAIRNVDLHGVGMTFDPKWDLFGNMRFTENDPYTIDSVGILGQYRKPADFGIAQGDSLIAVLSWSTSASTAHTFAGTQYAANSNNPLHVVRTQIVDKDTLQNVSLPALNQLRVGIALGENDVTSGNTLRWFSIPVGQNIPANNIVGVAYFFKSAHDSLLQPNDLYLSFVNPDSCKTPNFRSVFYRETNIPSSDATRYFADVNQWNVTSTLNSSVLYNLYTGNSAFLNNRFVPSPTRGYPTYAIVSGTTTLGVNEAEANKLRIYPNPASQTLFVSSVVDLKHVSLYSLEGKKVMERSSENLGSEIVLHIESLPKGLYIIEITDITGAKRMDKIVKK